jgi:hypothetical protein
MMADDWSKWIAELGTKPNPGNPPTLGSLKADHYYIMRQLHERTPEALEMEKSRQATLQTAQIFQGAIAQQTQAINAANEANEKMTVESMKLQMAEQQRKLEEQQRQFNELAAKVNAGSSSDRPAKLKGFADQRSRQVFTN